MRESSIHQTFGRVAFGLDPAGYDAARPMYPDWVFDFLRERCGLVPNTVTFEIGAGTGKATRRLLELGANPLVAVEPDERLAAFLRETIPDEALTVVVAPFEEAYYKKPASIWVLALLPSIGLTRILLWPGWRSCSVRVAGG